MSETKILEGLELLKHLSLVFGPTGSEEEVADEIIKLHDGEIQITSTLGEGTNVRILLPLERVQTAMNLTEKE